MKEQALKIAVIGGFGHIGSVLDEIQNDPYAEMTACAPVYEGEDITAVAAHRACGQTQRYSDYRRLLDAIRPDVAVIGTRLGLIADVAVDAARRGCHLICEKPIALSLNSLERLYQAVTEYKVNLTAMLSMKNRAAFRTARSLYHSGLLGRAVVLNIRKSYKWNGRPRWFGDRRCYGDTLGWVGVHALSIIRFVTGASCIALAAAQANRHHPDYPDCQDQAVVLAELDDGAYATISIDLCRPSDAATWGDDWLRLVGTKAALQANASRHTCSVLKAGDADCSDITLESDGAIYREFLDTVRTQQVDVALRNESCRLAYECLAARQAAEQRQWVRLESKFE